MLASALAVFGPIVVCCVAVYLRWQLADVNPDGALARVAVRRAPDDGAFFLDGPVRTSASVRGRSGSLCSRRQPELPHGPGVYVAGSCAVQGDGRDAALRGQLLADRIINGRFDDRRALRRGKKGALDVIVVGANAIGVSAALHLIHAGLRVLVVDRDSAAHGAGAKLVPELFPALRGKGRDARLPLLTGHSVSAVAERADGMLEVQAERAAWYSANVIFASTDSLARAAEKAASTTGSASRAA